MTNQTKTEAEGTPTVPVNINVNIPQGPTHQSGTAYALWCACLIGFCGLHRFYLGRPLSGILWLFSLGLLGLGQLYDLITMKQLVRKANTQTGV